ncbi:MAG: class I tRNA ligase family protein, partial [Acidobacteriota bacterium]|nr:class I tRNA ligase family protein [Acidobacteriota bacterium]
KFANKIWNASRLIFLNMERSGVEPQVVDRGELQSLEDRWIFSVLHQVAKSVNSAFEQHRYHEVAEILYHFCWHDFCDWYLEIKKLRLGENTGMTDDWRNLLSAYSEWLKLLHPIMPFQTEELWHRLNRTDSISLQPYPVAGVRDEPAEKEMALLQDIITSARNLRANVNRNVQLDAVLYADKPDVAIIEKLTNLKLEVRPPGPETHGFHLQINIPVDRKRLEQEIHQYQKLVADKDRQLSNEKFLAGAPPQVIESLREKRAEYQAQLEKSQAALS